MDLKILLYADTYQVKVSIYQVMDIVTDLYESK